jgi:transcription initiation factor TFIID subunit 2
LTLKSNKPKKPKPLAPEQASGMSATDLTACRSCLKKLFESRHAPLFMHPVDPVRDNAPSYFDVITDPMDLTSMMNQLNAGMYRDRFHFKSDFELITANAKKYTPDVKAYVHQEALALEKDFNRQWDRITKTLERAEAKHHKPETEAPAPAPDAAPAAVSLEEPRPAARIITTMPPPAHIPSPSPATPQPGPTSKPAGTGLGLKLKLKGRSSLTPAAGSPPPVASISGGSREQSATTAPRLAPPAASPPAAARAASPKAASVATPTRAVTPQKQSSSMSSPSPSTLDPVAAAGNEPIHPKRCKAVVATMRKLPEAFFFLRPVDAIADGVPT